MILDGFKGDGTKEAVLARTGGAGKGRFWLAIPKALGSVPHTNLFTGEGLLRRVFRSGGCRHNTFQGEAEGLPFSLVTSGLLLRAQWAKRGRAGPA